MPTNYPILRIANSVDDTSTLHHGDTGIRVAKIAWLTAQDCGYKPGVGCCTDGPAVIDSGSGMKGNDSKTIHYKDRQKRDAMPPRRISRTITFSLPPETFEQVQRLKEEGSRDMSELVREARRLYMEDIELRRQERLNRLRSSQAPS